MRLIDADNLNFEEQHYNKSQLNAILDFLDMQPTAYDVGKVKDRLNKSKEIYFAGNGHYEFAVRMDKAIEAVEAGGVNENR